MNGGLGNFQEVVVLRVVGMRGRACSCSNRHKSIHSAVQPDTMSFVKGKFSRTVDHKTTIQKLLAIPFISFEIRKCSRGTSCGYPSWHAVLQLGTQHQSTSFIV